MILEDISESEASERYDDYNDPRYFQANLKTGEGIIDTFNSLVNRLYEIYKDIPPKKIRKNLFKINEYLTLKLEKGKTNIYVKGTLLVNANICYLI